MKLKIFIGFIQCFCYFPVIFEIPWPPMVLDFMKMLELDFMDLFGDVSCEVQLGYLQKFAYHMALFPGIVINIWLMVCIAKCRQWRPRYTHASVNIQAFTLIS